MRKSKQNAKSRKKKQKKEEAVVGMASVDTIVLEDITTLNAQISSALLLGDKIVNQSGGTKISPYVQSQIRELESKKTDITHDILEKERMVYASNRDFAEGNPVNEPKTVLRVIEDHTVAILLLSYLFMLFMFMYWYVIQSPFIMKAIVEAIIGGFFFSIFSFMVLYYVC
jgi:hypothetical protein